MPPVGLEDDQRASFRSAGSFIGVTALVQYGVLASAIVAMHVVDRLLVWFTGYPSSGSRPLVASLFIIMFVVPRTAIAASYKLLAAIDPRREAPPKGGRWWHDLIWLGGFAVLGALLLLDQLPIPHIGY